MKRRSLRTAVLAVIALLCAAVAPFAWGAVAEVTPATDRPPGTDLPLPEHIEPWAATITFAAGSGRAGAATAADRALDVLRKANVRSATFPKTAGVRAISIALGSMSRRQAAAVYLALMSERGIDRVRLQRAETKSALADPVPAGAFAVGLILLPRSDGERRGLIANGNLTATGLAHLRSKAGHPFAGSRPLAGGMVAVAFAERLPASQAEVIRAALQDDLVEWVDLDLEVQASARRAITSRRGAMG